MPAPVKVTRLDHTPSELRTIATRCDDATQVRRILAIALILEGHSRTEAAEITGMERQTLRDWVHRYNEQGVDGLKSLHNHGRVHSLTAEQMVEFREMVLKGPVPEVHGVVRWRCCDLRDEIARRWDVHVHEGTVWKWLEKLGLSRIKPRPFHPKRDKDAQEDFKKNFAIRVAAALEGVPPETPIEVWFQDEARVGQQGGLARVWTEKGTRPTMVRDNRRTYAYLFGAVCPAKTTAAGLVMPSVNTFAMNQHLLEISGQVSFDAIAVVVMDGAGWHERSDELEIPSNIHILTLPAYSPELNPMENVWDFLRQNRLVASVWNGYEEIVDACSNAWNWFVGDSQRIASITTREWACVNR